MWTKEVCTAFGVELKDLKEEQRKADAAAPAEPKKEQAPADDEDLDGEGED